VTEGACCDDQLLASEVVLDKERIAYLRHLVAVLDALAAGVNLRGYFVWSLLDNFVASLRNRHRRPVANPSVTNWNFD
jgi:beta-glucosidase/6-phospho-beta-glucosidase/beta-galactosidase